MPDYEDESKEGIGKAGDEPDFLPNATVITELKFNIKEYEKKVKTSNGGGGGDFNSISDAVGSSLYTTDDGKLLVDYFKGQVLKSEGAGGYAQTGDSGGVTTWGMTEGSWKHIAPIVYPGVYKGTADELTKLSKDKEGSGIILKAAKIGWWDPAVEGSQGKNVPNIFKIMAFQDSWGGQNLNRKGGIWKNAKIICSPVYSFITLAIFYFLFLAIHTNVKSLP